MGMSALSRKRKKATIYYESDCVIFPLLQFLHIPLNRYFCYSPKNGWHLYAFK
jgi:hypothetical protein